MEPLRSPAPPPPARHHKPTTALSPPPARQSVSHAHVLLDPAPKAASPSAARSRHSTPPSPSSRLYGAGRSPAHPSFPSGTRAHPPATTRPLQTRLLHQLEPLLEAPPLRDHIVANGFLHVHPLYLHNISLYIPGGNIIKIRAGFTDELPIAGLLGRKGFFEHFKVTFDPSNNPPGFELERIYRT